MRGYELGIAGRYLWSARKRAHTAFLTLISTLALAVGVATLIVSLALLSGLQGEIKARLIADNPQLVIEPGTSRTIRDSAEVLKRSKRAGASKLESVISGLAWAANERTNAGSPIRLRSFDPAQPPRGESSFGRVWELPEQDPSRSISVSRDFATNLGLTLGDSMIVVAPRTRLTPMGPVPLWRKFTITRLLPLTGDAESSDALLSFEEASHLFDARNEPTSVEVFLPSDHSTEALQTSLSAAFPDLVVKSWKEINRPLFLALRLEKIVMFATISLIIFVAALNLVSCLSMVILEKRPQVGVLQTLGATKRSVLIIFLTVGLLVGLTGTILGNIMGLGAAWSANRFHLVPLPGEVYYMSHIPFAIESGDVLFVNIVSVVLSILATIYPAVIASRLDPITSIRGG
ncbi:MAG TPA: FtsX-like permease family protein [Thermoanaerobaculia bacterium]|nr:FtsX-like permease family protein [Thermoanaerobaculia bacterium]